jgi:hypothetical protein
MTGPPDRLNATAASSAAWILLGFSALDEEKGQGSCSGYSSCEHTEHERTAQYARQCFLVYRDDAGRRLENYGDHCVFLAIKISESLQGIVRGWPYFA